jgi:endonuclease V-like protein UPF0215 family
VKFWKIKPEIRVLGVDDGTFRPRDGNRVLLVGAVMRGKERLEGVLSTTVEKDGMDATERVVEMINGSRHRDQLRVVMSEGITVAGFNVLDLKEIFRRTGLPVLVVTRRRPDLKKVEKALRHLPGWRERWERMRRAGRIYPVKVRGGRIFMQLCGMEKEDAVEVLLRTTTHGLMPEPLRVAHLIATGVSRGESTRGG